MPDHSEHCLQYAYAMAHHMARRARIAELRLARVTRERDLAKYALLNDGPLAAEAMLAVFAVPARKA